MIDPLQDGGGDGENDTRRIEAALRKNVMDQVAVNTAVAILEWVDVDETECEDCGGNHGIERLRGTPVEGDHTAYQRRQILRTGADVIGQRHAGFSVMRSDETALPAKSRFYEAGIAEHDMLQAQQFFGIERLPAGFSDGAAPTLDAVLRRALALDGIAGA